MSNSLIEEMEYYIDIEQDFSKRSVMRNMLNEYIDNNKIIKNMCKELEEMEKAFNKGKVNPILIKEHQELQTKYNKLENKISKICKIIDEG